MIGWKTLLGFALPSWLLPSLLAGLTVISLSGAYLKGRSDANANCRTAALQARIDILQRDASVQKAAADLEEKQRIEAEARNAMLEGKLDDYEAKLSYGKHIDCDLTADDIEQLRKLEP